MAEKETKKEKLAGLLKKDPYCDEIITPGPGCPECATPEAPKPKKVPEYDNPLGIKPFKRIYDESGNLICTARVVENTLSILIDKEKIENISIGRL